MYASLDLKDYLMQKKTKFTYIDDGDIDHRMLRNLDETENGIFRVLITSEKALAIADQKAVVERNPRDWGLVG